MDQSLVMSTRPYRHVLGSFATGVCVMTVPDPDHVAGHVLGITANSFSSISLEPPLVQWCLDFKAHRYAVYAGARSFGINILSGSQTELSRRFARQNAHIVPEEGLISNLHPLRLNDVIGFLNCDVYETRPLGDHLVIVGQVTSYDLDPAQAGLTFFKGQYGQI
jgi:flavin reductase (DIM6/NTAB) family NADH-FMN oxidoreductase RutF